MPTGINFASLGVGSLFYGVILTIKEGGYESNASDDPQRGVYSCK